MLIRRAKNTKLPLEIPIPIPEGLTEEALFKYVSGFCVEGAPVAELQAYVNQDFRRFVHALGLLSIRSGRVLEVGANPYFTSLLVRKLTTCELVCTNWFGDGHPPEGRQRVINRETGESVEFPFRNHNLERDDLPDEEEFDAVLLCEVIEHLIEDPLAVLLRVHRALKSGGRLVLTTPNAARLANVARLISGANVYDQYSGQGPYGRHNREYTRHEMFQLLQHAGFEIESFFTSDIHRNEAADFYDLDKLAPMVEFRREDLGQYLFCAARKAEPGDDRKPQWLYRSYPREQLADAPI